MKIWGTAALVSTLLLAACGGGHHNDEDEISPDDASAMMQAVVIKVGGQPTALVAGAPPATSTTAAKPLAKVEGSDVSIGPGGVAGFDLTLTPDALAAICKIFVKVGGADSFAETDLSCPAPKAAKTVGAPQEFFVSVQVPTKVSEGRFCLEMSGQDSAGRVSNVAETCVNVDSDAGGGGDQNLPPVADAGADRAATAGQTVVLNGAGSTDADGSIVSYQWQQIGGPSVTLQNASSPFASFIAPAQASVLTFTLVVTDNSGDQAQDAVTITTSGAVTTPPAVTLTISSGSITLGQTATLQWASTNATACTASGDWSGSKPTSGSQGVTPSATGSYTYTLTCDGAAGTTPATDSATLTVAAAGSQQPTVTISVTPSTVSTGQSATLQWSSTNATSCTASGAWSGAQTTSGSQGVSQGVAGTYDYTLTCSGASGTTPASDTATLTVTTVAQPTVDLTITPSSVTPGQSATLQWTSTNSIACTASNSWSGTKPSSGNEATSQNTPGSYTYTLTCSGQAGTTPASDSATLTVTGSGTATVSLLHSFGVTAGDGEAPYGSVVQGSDGNFYGTTRLGGAGNLGTVFRITPSGTETVLHTFAGGTTDGGYPYGSLIQASDGDFYGTTQRNGANNGGIVFKITSSGTFTLVHSFAPVSDGSGPLSGLVEGSDGNFYGTTSDSPGTVFKMTPAGSMTVLHAFAGGPGDGSTPYYGSLIEGSDGNFYGTTVGGGVNGRGTVFQITPAGVLTVLHSFNSATSEADAPVSGLIQASDGDFYGTTTGGGTNHQGTVFKITASGTFTVLYSFGGSFTDGSGGSDAALVEGGDGNFYGTTLGGGGSSNAGTVFRITPSGTETVLHSFAGQPNDGSLPYARMIIGSDGNLYGTTQSGGTNGLGTVFKVTGLGLSGGGGGGSSSVIHSMADATEGANPYIGLVEASDGNLYGATCQHGTTGDGTIFRSTTAGVVSVVHDFVSSTDGECPRADLIEGADGNLYGTTSMGGAGGCGGAGCGTAFRVALNGTFAVLHAFQDTDGNSPTGLIQATDGNFYGTTFTGGTLGGLGVVFKMTSNGTVTLMHTFAGGSTDGAEPWNLMQASDGILYGVTRKGGPIDAGTLYKMTTAGVMTTLRFFDGTNVGSPVGKLVEGADGKLYGTAAQGLSIGGTQDRGALFRIDKDGSNFEILHKFFDDATDGDSPVAGMIFAGGNLYGTTVFGGADGKGVVFQMAPDGTGYTVVYGFEGHPPPPSIIVDGENPEAGLVQAADGNLYGTTRQGGAEDVGVLYRIVPGP